MGWGPFMSFKSLLWSKKGNGAVYKRMGYFACNVIRYDVR